MSKIAQQAINCFCRILKRIGCSPRKVLHSGDDLASSANSKKITPMSGVTLAMCHGFIHLSSEGSRVRGRYLITLEGHGPIYLTFTTPLQQHGF